MGLQYLTYDNINRERWDECIRRSNNGLIYAFSFYLDKMAARWDAVVYGDYDIVMPLPWKKKYGFYYLYQPPFTANLGIFNKKLSAGLVEEFLLAIPARFRYWDISLNSGNMFQLDKFKLNQRVNYILPLQENYDTLFSRFRDSTIRNIKKSEQSNLVVKQHIDINEVVGLSRQQAKNFASLTEDDFTRFRNLYTILLEKSAAMTIGVYLPSGELAASAAFLFSHRRAYYILVGNSPMGKTLGASHALINAFIKGHAGTDIVLDFEGSDIPSLAFFYSSFGAKMEIYPSLLYNRLPAVIKWMKKKK